MNKDGGRIDTYTPQPSDDSLQRYKDLSPRPLSDTKSNDVNAFEVAVVGHSIVSTDITVKLMVVRVEAYVK